MPAPEPWKRAANLSRLRQQQALGSARGTPSVVVVRTARPVWPWIALLLALAAAGGVYVWGQRGVLIPKYAKQLPEPAAKAVERTPLPVQQIDVAALDGGAGIGLTLGGDYLNLIAATRPWQVKWKAVALGGSQTRLDAPGLTVFAAGSKIRGYRLDVKDVFGSTENAGPWQPWRKKLADAGITPELNWRTATGEAEMPKGLTEHVLTGRGGLKFGGEPATTAYTLVFRDGWLVRVEAAPSLGNIPPPIVESDTGKLADDPPVEGPVRPPATTPTG
jgi:hypothetical protein